MSDKNTPPYQTDHLEEALVSGDINSIKECLSYNSDVNFITKSELPLLLEVLKNKDLTNKNILVDILLSFGANIDIKDHHGVSSVMISAQLGDVEITESLLLMNANINDQDQTGKTPIMFAIDSGSINLIDLLIIYGANLEIKDNNGHNALLYAIKHLDSHHVDELQTDHLDQETLNEIIENDIHHPIHDKETLLDITKYLINHHVNINSQDNNLNTASIYAIENNNKEVLKELLNAGSDLSLKNIQGQTAIDIAIKQEYHEIVTIINEASQHLHQEVHASLDSQASASEPSSSLDYESMRLEEREKNQKNVKTSDYDQLQSEINDFKKGDEQTLSYDQGPASNDSEYDDLAPNMSFSFDNQSETSENDEIDKVSLTSFQNLDFATDELDNRIMSNPDTVNMDIPNIGDEKSSFQEKIDTQSIGKSNYKEEISDHVTGQTHFKEEITNADYVQHSDTQANTERIKLPPDINKRNKDGQTPLMMAAAQGDQEQIMAILKRKANPALRDIKGNTALMYASMQSNIETVKLILSQDHSVLNLKNSDGNTAMSVATMKDQAQVVSFLINSGAHYQGLYKGMDLMMLASSTGSIEVIKALLPLGFNPFKRNVKGKSAIEYAQENKHKDVILFFKNLMDSKK